MRPFAAASARERCTCGAAQYIAYALPVLLVAAGKPSVSRSARRE